MIGGPAVPGGGRRRIIPDRRTAALLGLVMIAAFLVRLDLLQNSAPRIAPAPAVSDAAAYRLLGQGLARGDGYVRPFDLQRQGVRVTTAEYPPGFPLLLAKADLLGLKSETGQRALLCLIGSLTVGLVGLIGRRLGGDGVGLLAATIAALHPSLWSTDTSPLAEPLAVWFAMATVLAALAVYDRPIARRWLLLGALAGLGGLVRTELLVLGPLLMFPLAWRLGDTRRRQMGALALGIASMLAVVAPWTIRNAVVFGRFVPVSNNMGSVVRGANCEGAYRGEFRGLWVTNVSEVGGDQVDPAGRCFTGFDLGRGAKRGGVRGETPLTGFVLRPRSPVGDSGRSGSSYRAHRWALPFRSTGELCPLRGPPWSSRPAGHSPVSAVVSHRGGRCLGPVATPRSAEVGCRRPGACGLGHSDGDVRKPSFPSRCRPRGCGPSGVGDGRSS